MDTLQSILTYYKALGFEIGEDFVLRATGENTKIYFGRLSEDNFELWEAKWKGEDSDGVKIYEPSYQVSDPVRLLQALGLTRYNIFSYPNHVAFGLGNKHAKKFTCLFWEHDDLTLDEQKQKTEEFTQETGLQPSLSVFSGSKSLHNYLRLTSGVSADEWVELNRMLAIVQGSDPNICTLARAMRLPGVQRIKNEQKKDVEIVSSSFAVYSPQEVKKALEGTGKFPYGLSDERWRKWRREGDSILSIPEDELYPKPNYTYTPTSIRTSGSYIPLEHCLSRTNQENLNGVSSDRNQTGFTLAKDSIGAADWLNKNGYNTDDPYQLFTDYCQSCTPGRGWNHREWDLIWHSAQRSNSTPAKREEGLEKAVHWYLWNNDLDYQAQAKKEWAAQQNDKKLPGELSKEEWQKGQDKKTISLFLIWLSAKAQNLNPLALKKGFSLYKPVALPTEIHYKPEDILPSPEDYKGRPAPKIICKKKDKLKLTLALKKAGWIDIADTSFMGLGKSHDAGMLASENGIRIFYFDINHRNVSTSTVRNNFVDLNPRHNGLYQDANSKLKLKGEQGQEPDVTPNCYQAANFVSLKNKDYDVEGDGNPICKKCPWVVSCKTSEGHGFGFKKQRHEALSHPLVRLHLESLPSGQDYSNDIAIIEEAGQQLTGTKTKQGTWDDLLKQFDLLEAKNPELAAKLSPLKSVLRSILKGEIKQGKYGLDHQELMASLPAITEDIEQIIWDVNNIVQPDFDKLIEKPDSVAGGKEFKSAAATVRKYFRTETRQQNQANLDNLPNNLLVDLLRIWNGEPGAMRVKFDTLTLTVPYERPGALLRGFGTRLYLDATFNKQHTAKLIDIDPNSIIEVQAEIPPTNNVIVYNTNMQGLGSRDRSATAENRVKAYMDYSQSLDPNVKFLDHKGATEEINYCWFNDNRGSNDFDGIRNIVSFGTPYPNVGQVQDEYLTLYGTLDGFDDYYKHLVAAEILQWVGRSRFHRYPDQKFTIDLVGTNIDLSFLTEQYGIEVINRESFDLCPETGTKAQIQKRNIGNAVKGIVKAGAIATQKKVAASLGISQGQVSKRVSSIPGGVRGLVKIFHFLYYSPNRDRNISLEYQNLIRHWLELPPIEKTFDVMQEFLAAMKGSKSWSQFRDEYLSLVFDDEFALQIVGFLIGLVASEEELVKFTKMLRFIPH